MASNLFSRKQFKFFVEAIKRYEEVAPLNAFVVQAFLAQEFKNNCPNFDLKAWNKALADKLS